MAAIDRIGTFKGRIIEGAVGATRQQGLPQFTVKLVADAWYDETSGEWLDWTEYDQTITGYINLVYFDKNGNLVKNLTYDNLCQITGWDGTTYSGLAALDVKDKPLQFRVEENDYNGTVTLRVQWVDVIDASPGLKKLDAAELKALDAKFAVASPKKAAAKPKKAPAKTKAPTPEVVTPPKPKAGTPTVEEETTEADAWNDCLEANKTLDVPVEQEILEDYWVSAITDIAADPNNVTGAEYVAIRNKVLEQIDIPF